MELSTTNARIVQLHNLGKTYQEIGDELGLGAEAVRSRFRWINDKIAENVATEDEAENTEIKIVEDRRIMRLSDENRVATKKVKQLLTRLEEMELDIEAAFDIKNALQTYEIKPKAKNRSESTAFLILSDWHIEQRVDLASVSQLNEFNPEIGKDRVERAFRKAVDFIHMYQQDTEITTLVVALLGDFINGNIHDELKESNYLLPVDAAIYAGHLIASGLEYILRETQCNLVIPCHSGNHARFTAKVHHSTEHGNSLEYYLYHNLRAYFRNEPRIEFIVSEGYHSYLSVYGRTIRFHHGHDIKYGGGIGGLFVPAYKAIAAWNKARPAELDVFGHFHQTKDGGSFLCNGSLVGYDAFALSIKADYEQPKQSFFLYHKDLGRSIMSPIYL